VNGTELLNDIMEKNGEGGKKFVDIDPTEKLLCYP
jgi:hypothetical protein